MLSILIPTYNYDITHLVYELHEQATNAGIDFEIISFDDGSLSELNSKNQEINLLDYSRFKALSSNIGRSAIRNLLAKEAQYEILLFLDADVEIINHDFISNYLKIINANTQIIYGGIQYPQQAPDSTKLLRWVYGRKREAPDLRKRKKNPYVTFLTLNFLIRRSLFSSLSFNETMPNLRIEDLVFAMDAKQKNILVEHIDNPVIHLGIETSEVFLNKTMETLNSYNTIINTGVLNSKDALITRVATSIKRLKLVFIFKFLSNSLNPFFKKNLLSNHPSLFIFDVFRLCYFLKIKPIK